MEQDHRLAPCWPIVGDVQCEPIVADLHARTVAPSLADGAHRKVNAGERAGPLAPTGHVTMRSRAGCHERWPYGRRAAPSPPGGPGR